MFTHVMVTLDGSPYGERALTHAVDIAADSDARVTLLTVVPSDALPHETAISELDTRRLELSRDYLEPLVRDLRSAGVQDVTSAVRLGVPARTITATARELDVDVIVMSTQGLGADTDYGLGSVALKVLASAPCPVLMVRVGKSAPPQTPAEERWQSEGGANVG